MSVPDARILAIYWDGDPGLKRNSAGHRAVSYLLAGALTTVVTMVATYFVMIAPAYFI